MTRNKLNTRYWRKKRDCNRDLLLLLVGRLTLLNVFNNKLFQVKLKEGTIPETESFKEFNNEKKKARKCVT